MFRFDKEINKTEKLEINLPKQKNKKEIKQIIYFNDKVILFYTQRIKKEKISKVFYQTINTKTFKLNNDEKFLNTLYHKSFFDRENIFFSFTDDQKYLIASVLSTKKVDGKREYKGKYNFFDDQLKIVDTKTSSSVGLGNMIWHIGKGGASNTSPIFGKSSYIDSNNTFYNIIEVKNEDVSISEFNNLESNRKITKLGQ